MNRKISVLVLGAYMCSTAVPVVTLAEPVGVAANERDSVNALCEGDSFDHVDGVVTYVVSELREHIVSEENDGYLHFVAGNGVGASVFKLSNSTVASLIDGMDDREILTMAITCEENTGNAKEFQDKFEELLVGDTPTYVSDFEYSQDEDFEENIYTFKILDDSIKAGDKLTLHAVPQDSDDLNLDECDVATAVVTESVVAGEKYLEVSFEVSIAPSNVTLFTTRETPNTDKEEGKEEDKEEENKEEDKDDDNVEDKDDNIFEVFGKYDDNGYGKFDITYDAWQKYIDEAYTGEYVYINGPSEDDNTFELGLNNKNIEDMFSRIGKDKSVGVTVSGNLSGIAKKFSNAYKDKVLFSVTVESDELKDFKWENSMNVGVANGYVYSAPTGESGKIEYLGKSASDATFETKTSLNNRTIFVTKEEVKLNADGSLPDTSGFSQILAIFSAISVFVGGMFMVFSKKKKAK